MDPDRAAVEARLAALEAQIAGLRTDMEGACRAFLQATLAFAVEWFQRRVEQAVVDDPEIAKVLGRDGLRRLKADLRKLVEQAPDLVSSLVNRDQLWAHRPALIDSSAALLNPELNPYEFRGDRAPPLLNGAVAEVLARAEALLAAFGLAPPEPAGLPGFPVSRSRRRILLFTWSEDMRGALGRYAELYARLRTANSDLRPLRRKRVDGDAKRLWDEV
jgi:hypothetical protein